MVYIFGGGLCGGSANVVSLNASRLVVRQQVIVVSVSYRLGALGFCPLPDFPGGGSGGMNGIYDIIVALRWLKANVAPFGGDPGNVMLFGQSSGSYAICTLCVAPAAAGLFSKVALQSGPCLGGPPGRGWGPVTSVSPSAIAREVMAQLNVTSGIEGLRAVRDATRIQWPSRYMEDLDVAPYFSAYFPDDAVVRSPPADLWAAGAIHPRAMLVGGTSKDGTAAFYGTAPTLGNIAPDPVCSPGEGGRLRERRPVSSPPPPPLAQAQLGDAAYETALKGAWGAAARAVRAHYPLSRFGGSAQAAFVQADADAYVLCPQTEAARMAVAAGVAVWHYEFSHFMPSPTAPGGGCDNGVELDVVEAGASATWATHGAEVRYVFGSEQNHDTLSGRPRIADCPFSPAERRLSDEIGAYWAGLAREGDPNSGGGAGGGRAWWPAYGAGANWTSLVLGVGGGVARAQLHGSACNFWTQLGGESTWSTWSAVIQPHIQERSAK